MDSAVIKRNIKQILPNLSDDSCKKVIERLDAIGVETVEDLSFVHEGDLSDILKLVQIRKLFQSWKSLSGNDVSPQAQPQVTYAFHKNLERLVIELFIKFFDGKIGIVHVKENCLVEDLFRAVYDLPQCPKTCGIHIIYHGQVLANNSGKRLHDYGLHNECTLHVGLRLTGG